MHKRDESLENGLAFRRYDRDADASWVILLPGTGAAAAIWRRQVQFLRLQYNLLSVDLPGHGRSPHGSGSGSYSFESIAAQIVKVLDREKIACAHIISMSLGGVIADTVALIYPERIMSIIMAGGIADLNPFATSLMYIGRVLNPFLPYIALYRIFAWIIMPGRAHRPTRKLFAAHAVRLGRDEFLRWYRMCTQVRRVLARAANRPTIIPTLFVIGQSDYLFHAGALRRAQKRSDTKAAFIERSGHVCSVEQPESFNRVVAAFLASVEAKKSYLG